MAYTMYDTLLQIPPFQGMSRSELSAIIEKVKFNFMKFADKEVIFHQGERCDKLAFFLSGKLASETAAPCERFRFVETHDQPMIIEPHSLFGKNPSYKSTYTAQGEVAMLTIDKRYFYSVLDKYEIFRMNFFNLLSNRAELLYNRIWSITPQELEGRLIHFIHSLCTNLQGAKVLHVKMEDLALLLDDTRLNVSNVLNKWQEEGIIEMHRKEFVFLDVERLRAI
ncbi:MAG: Crp/Fnr family transcriptional regulator [Bacteroidaceae bacterium]|mgnify:FL=1|nr:Crp/Fnr family transcriptional regulator [Bacteroidaceae bacterium]